MSPLSAFRRRMRHAALAGLAGSVLALAGCGPSSGGSSEELADLISSISAPYALLDLPTGTITWRNELPDAGTNPAYRDRVMVFRRVGSGSSECLVGIFEVTQAQWERLDGSPPVAPDVWPWEAVSTNVVPGSAHAGDRPVYGVDLDGVVALVTAYSPSGPARLTLPTVAQWRLAAGTAAGWTWGATANSAQLEANAWVQETIGATNGPRSVGSLSASNQGFFDLHGNVWEWTLDGSVHGGSWRDNHRSSRAETSLGAAEGVTSNLEHALFGARLVLLP